MTYQTPPPMETSLQSPSIDSFSYSWPASVDPSDHDEASFIEMDPRLPPSRRFIKVSSDFTFDFPVAGSPLGLVHADELISNGFLVPLGAKMEEAGSGRAPGRVRCASLRRCQRLSKRLLKLLLRPLMLYKWRGGHRGNLRMGRNGWGFSAATSPRTSSAEDNWRRSCDSESSIYEAVLHCKRTQGTYVIPDG